MNQKISKFKLVIVTITNLNFEIFIENLLAYTIETSGSERSELSLSGVYGKGDRSGIDAFEILFGG